MMMVWIAIIIQITRTITKFFTLFIKLRRDNFIFIFFARGVFAQKNTRSFVIMGCVVRRVCVVKKIILNKYI